MNMYYEVLTPRTQEEAIEQLKEELAKVGFGVLWEINLKSKFNEKGLAYAYDFWVFEVCNPHLAIDVLNYDQKAGYMLPCKICIYDSEEGLHVGLARPSQLIGLLQNSNELEDVAKKVENILMNVVDHFDIR